MQCLLFHKFHFQIDPLKLHIGKKLIDIFHTNPMVAVLHHNDWNVAEWQKFRLSLVPTEIHVQVIRTKIATRALEVTKYKNVTSLFRGPTCIMYCHEPKVKELVAVIKKENKLLLLGGVLNDVLVTRNDFMEYAKLPSLEESQGQLVSQLTVSSSQISTVLLKHQRDLLYILSQRANSTGLQHT